jgi:hypothetical protein
LGLSKAWAGMAWAAVNINAAPNRYFLYVFMVAPFNILKVETKRMGKGYNIILIADKPSLKF